MMDFVKVTHVVNLDTHSIYRLVYHDLVMEHIIESEAGDPRLGSFGLGPPLPQLHQPISIRHEYLVWVHPNATRDNGNQVRNVIVIIILTVLVCGLIRRTIHEECRLPQANFFGWGIPSLQLYTHLVPKREASPSKRVKRAC